MGAIRIDGPGKSSEFFHKIMRSGELCLTQKIHQRDGNKTTILNSVIANSNSDNTRPLRDKVVDLYPVKF